MHHLGSNTLRACLSLPVALAVAVVMGIFPMPRAAAAPPASLRAESREPRAESRPPGDDAHESAWIEYIAAQWRSPLERVTAEYALADGSRADLYQVTELAGRPFTSVWEVERAAKWKEAIGQAAFYQTMTRADLAGVVLVSLEGEADHLFILRAAIACRRTGLRLFLVTGSGRVREFPTDPHEPLEGILLRTKRSRARPLAPSDEVLPVDQ